jgi:hypothetical protein
MFGTNTIQLECSVPLECEGTNLMVQDWSEVVRLWLVFGLIFSRAHPSDAASDSIGSAPSGRTSDGEVD